MGLHKGHNERLRISSEFFLSLIKLYIQCSYTSIIVCNVFISHY